ncbi:MAG: molybdopterin-dependent oxidoreductase, partial [Bradymonadia bacterium]
MHQPTSDSTPIRVTRRRALGHLVNAVGLLALGGCTGDRTQRTSKRLDATVRALNLPKTKYAGLPFNLNPEDFHIHNRSPLALETKRKQMPSTAITPIEKLFVRNNLPRPPEHFVSNPDTWSLKITGVKKPTTLTVKQLKALGDPTSRLTVLQCSG